MPTYVSLMYVIICVEFVTVLLRISLWLVLVCAVLHCNVACRDVM